MSRPRAGSVRQIVVKRLGLDRGVCVYLGLCMLKCSCVWVVVWSCVCVCMCMCVYVCVIRYTFTRVSSRTIVCTFANASTHQCPGTW